MSRLSPVVMLIAIFASVDSVRGDYVVVSGATLGAGSFGDIQRFTDDGQLIRSYRDGLDEEAYIWRSLGATQGKLYFQTFGLGVVSIYESWVDPPEGESSEPRLVYASHHVVHGLFSGPLADVGLAADPNGSILTPGYVYQNGMAVTPAVVTIDPDAVNPVPFAEPFQSSFTTPLPPTFWGDVSIGPGGTTYVVEYDPGQSQGDVIHRPIGAPHQQMGEIVTSLAIDERGTAYYLASGQGVATSLYKLPVPLLGDSPGVLVPNEVLFPVADPGVWVYGDPFFHDDGTLLMARTNPSTNEPSQIVGIDPSTGEFLGVITQLDRHLSINLGGAIYVPIPEPTAATLALVALLLMGHPRHGANLTAR